MDLDGCSFTTHRQAAAFLWSKRREPASKSGQMFDPLVVHTALWVARLQAEQHTVEKPPPQDLGKSRLGASCASETHACVQPFLELGGA